MTSLDSGDSSNGSSSKASNVSSKRNDALVAKMGRRPGPRGGPHRFERAQSSLTSSDEDYDEEEEEEDDEEMQFYYCGEPSYGMQQVCM